MLKNIMRGSDPEVFLIDQNNLFVSSIGLIGGSKQEPRDIGDGYSLQEDNVSVEFNIPPAKDRDAFVNSILYSLSYIENEIREKYNLGVSIVPTATFDDESLKHPKAMELGCEPDFNAWTMEQNPRPIAPKNLRSAGGHLHLSWDNPKMLQKIRVIKAHDLFCGVPSLLHDTNTQRREIYGKAGACRFKDYGVEYRTLSNFWLQSKELIDWVYTQSEKAIDFINNEKAVDKDDLEKIVTCINTSDMKLFHELNEKYSLVG